METNVSEIQINGVAYVPKGSEQPTAKDYEGNKYVIVRTQSAGVFAGYLSSREGQEVTLLGARRIWYWKGAASLSQLAVDGTSCPKECKFPAPVSRINLLQVIEILEVTDKAKRSIESVKVWAE